MMDTGIIKGLVQFVMNIKHTGICRSQPPGRQTTEQMN
jgi:hypothetical protein